MFHLKTNCTFTSVIYYIVYFAVPGQVEDLTLIPFSHKISVNWKTPSINSNCVAQYVIKWVHTVSESKNSSSVSRDRNSFVIEDLDACVVYNVSVSAVNKENESEVAERHTGKTQTAGNYHAQIISSCL
jgi:hypothetical protein